MTWKGIWIGVDNEDSSGRWACVIGDAVAIRCRSKTEAKRLARSGNRNGSNFRYATMRRWRKGRLV